MHNKNVDIDDVFRFTQAYYSDPDAIYTDSHHQYHITSTLSRTVTNGSVFDTINHIDNDYDQQLQKQRSRSASQSYHDLEKQEGQKYTSMKKILKMMMKKKLVLVKILFYFIIVILMLNNN